MRSEILWDLRFFLMKDGGTTILVNQILGGLKLKEDKEDTSINFKNLL